MTTGHDIDFKVELKRLINEKNISISKLSRLADIHPGSIHNYLHGKSEMNAGSLEKLINTLKNI